MDKKQDEQQSLNEFTDKEKEQFARMRSFIKGGLVTYLCMGALLVVAPNFNTLNVTEYEGSPNAVRVERIGRDAIRIDSDGNGSYESSLNQYLNRNFDNKSDRIVETERIRNQVDWYEP
ncbi:hypothetical protein HOC80_02035 [archaeon]|mgnify:CR=1 FL=1|jgi:hypothetical protein|nr:hypothetical protein [archaeon]MBT4416861.1 hypothetical protein [archaeon]